ncbi:MAG: PQQ-binding-like beta-propeller repeat protein [Polyangiales bacterium]
MLSAACAALALSNCTPDDSAVSSGSGNSTLGQQASSADAGTPAAPANPAAPAAPNASLPGKALYDRNCAFCHAAPDDARTPTFAVLTALPPATIRGAINEGGKMAAMAAGLSAQQKEQLIEYLTSGQIKTDEDWTKKIMCPADGRTVDVSAAVASNGFSVDRNQTRSFTGAQAGISKAQLSNLEIAWTLAFPGQGNGSGTAVVGNTVFTTGGGYVLALNADTGCAKWLYKGDARNTPTFGELGGKKVVAFSIGIDIHVLDAATGKKIWQANGQATDNVGQIRGGVAIHNDKVIVPISASGVVAGQNAQFECCTGHGAVVALAGKDGTKLWEYHTMPTAQYNGLVSSMNVRQRGPSGAPIWAFPLIDDKRNRVIVATGENTSHPATDTSDAIIAIDLDTGKEVWKFQAMAQDIWNMACSSTPANSGPNCPWNIPGDLLIGRDYDFGAGVLLAKGPNGADVLLAGQKSGDVWAIDPASGKKLWNIRFGQGTSLGGIHWGVTSDGQRLFAAINDPQFLPTMVVKPGIFAVDIHTGKQVWGFDAKPSCEGDRNTRVTNCASRYGFSAAPITVDGAVVGGTLGGELVILDSTTGAVLNRIDTATTHTPINPELPAKGGSIDSHAISAGAGKIFINSGYGLFSQTPGNALIAYRAKK